MGTWLARCLLLSCFSLWKRSWCGIDIQGEIDLGFCLFHSFASSGLEKWTLTLALAMSFRHSFYGVGSVRLSEASGKASARSRLCILIYPLDSLV
jgi:hypothetical protein